MYRECRLLMYIFCIHFLYIDNLQNIGTVNVVSSLSDLIMLPNCLFSTAVPNCSGAKLSTFHCGANLSFFHCGAIFPLFIAVPNCPRCQIVLGSSLNGVPTKQLLNVTLAMTCDISTPLAFAAFHSRNTPS